MVPGASRGDGRASRDTAGLLGRHTSLVWIAIVGAAAANVAFELRGLPQYFGDDFRAPMLDASRALVHGRNPYPAGGQEFHNVAAVVVMPVVLFAISPLTLLPEETAVDIWIALLALAAVAVVPVLGLGQRYFWLWLTGAPVVIGLLSGNTILLVALALACAWRFRDRPGIAGAGVAVAVVLKLWPATFVVWLWVTGRRRAALYAVAGTAAAIVLPWAAIGFRGLRGYPGEVSDMSGDLAPYGSWLIAWLIDRGASYHLAAAIGLVLALALLAASAIRGPDSLRFVLAAVAGITATAVSWLHYLCLFVLPTRGRSWLLLPALWLPIRVGREWGPGPQAATTLIVVVAWAALVVSDRRRSPEPRAR
jgi:hypothetical protein